MESITRTTPLLLTQALIVPVGPGMEAWGRDAYGYGSDRQRDRHRQSFNQRSSSFQIAQIIVPRAGRRQVASNPSNGPEERRRPVARQVGATDRVAKHEPLVQGRHVAGHCPRRWPCEVHGETASLGGGAKARKIVVWVVAIDRQVPPAVGAPEHT